jgi:hypothetical protein
MSGLVLLCVLAAGGPPSFDAFLASPPVYAPGDALDAQARALFDHAYVSGFEARTGVPTVLWAPPPFAGQRSLRDLGLTDEQAARRHLFTWAPVYRFAPGALAEATLSRVHDLGQGAVVVTFTRRVNGLPVFMSELHVVMTQSLELVALTGHLPPQRPNTTFSLQAEAAVGVASLDLCGRALEPSQLKALAPGEGGWVSFRASSLDSSPRARAGFYALPRRLVPAWQVELQVDGQAAGYVISAEDGAVLARVPQVAQHDFRAWADTTAPYTPWDGPWGDSTPHPTGQLSYVGVPTAAPLISLTHAGLSTGDPWLAPGATFLEGNNVEAYLDLYDPSGRNDPDAGLPRLSDGGVPDGGFDDAGVPWRAYTDPRVSVTSPGVFDYPSDFTASPTTPSNQNAGAVHAFFVTNWLHDLFYDLGFNEQAGNAQTNNFGRGGASADPMYVELQDSSGRDNANMFTPADGRSPVMQMYLWGSSGASRVVVNNPATLANTLPAVTPYPGALPWQVTGSLVVGLGPDGGLTDCGPFGSSMSGKVLLLNRAGCIDAVRLANAADAGALGAIISISTNAAATPPLDPPLPAHLVGTAAAAPWRAALAQGTPIDVTLDARPLPDRDSAIDSLIVSHEWTHQLTNRLVGDSFGLITTQARGLGEGWSDFVAIVTSLRPGDVTAASNPGWNGTWAVGSFVGGGLSRAGDALPTFYYGIRRYPYSADVSKNPLRFHHVSQGAALPALPVAGIATSVPPEVHDVGEVWAQMLWECQVRLLRSSRYTVPQAEHAMLGYLVAALKATPVQPTFTEARDALLAVVRAASPNDDFPLLVEAFASRGLGLGAQSPPKETLTFSPLVEDNDTTGARWRLVSLTLADETTGGCDSDGFLDQGESGQVTVTLQNVGAKALSSSTLALAADDARFKVPQAAVTVPAAQPFETVVVHVPVSLVPGPGGSTGAWLTVDVKDAQAAKSLREQVPVRLDVDAVASATEGFEAAPPNFYVPITWDIGADSDFPTSQLFHSVALTPAQHVVIGGDPTTLGTHWLKSPALQVGQAPLSFSFTHTYAFDTSGGINFWDGAVVQVSTDGDNFDDVPATAVSPAYDAPIRVSGNPLAGKLAFVGAHLAPVTTTVDLGTQYAGKTIWVSFVIGSDNSDGATGWVLDDVAFTGITNTPFTALVPHRKHCSANLPPVITAPDDVTADERSAVVLVPKFMADPNGDPVTVQWTQLAGPAVTLPPTTLALQLVLPEVSADAQLTLRATASDGHGGTASDDVVVTVRNVNRAPAFASVGATSPVTSGDTVTLQASAVDPDGDAVTYAWTQLAGPQVDFAPGAASPSFTAPAVTEPTVLTFAVVARDASSATPTVSVDVLVNPAPVKGCGCGEGGLGPVVLAAACWLLLRLRRRGVLAAGLAFVLAGCGGPTGVDAGPTWVFVDAGGAGDAGISLDAGPGLDAGRAVTVLTRTWYSSSPSEPVPKAQFAGAIAAWCPLPDGGLGQVATSEAGEGALVLAGLPPGPCLVGVVRGDQVWTASSTVDLATRVLGRVAAAPVAVGNSPTLRTTLGGMAPWDVTHDSLSLASLETGWSTNTTLIGSFLDGGTSGAVSVVYNLTTGAVPGLSSADGDHVVVQQQRTFDRPTPHRAPVAMGQAPAPTVVRGLNSSVTVPMTPSAPTALALTHDFALYVQQAAEHHPAAIPGTGTLLVQAQPAWEQLGVVRESPTGSPFTLPRLVATGGVLSGTYQLGASVPNTSSWVTASQPFTVKVQVPGEGTTSFSIFHARTVPFADFHGGLVPALSPVTSLRVNGVDAWVPQLTGVQPRLSWGPPRLGTPDAYRVVVTNLWVTNTLTRVTACTAVTTERSFVVPPGVLATGRPWIFTVRALTGSGWRHGGEANPAVQDEEYADALSEALVP